MTSKNIYFYTHFAPEVRDHLEAGAFRALCQHLRDRSGSVHNIDLMIVGGFGRNCLAKWLVKAARQLSSQMVDSDPKGVALLDAFGHSQATREVYGCDFFKWKKKYPENTTLEQVQRYQEALPIQAVHKEDTMLKTGMTVAMTEEFDSKFKMKVEAGAFRSLLDHLSDRSDVVQNIDLMTTAGFCRNCLAKWLVIEARKLSTIIKGVCEGTFTDEEKQLVTDLDAFSYDEAARYVYRMDYDQWKEAHQKKVTEKKMALLKASTPIHAKHDKELLQTKCEKGPPSFDAPPDEPKEETKSFSLPASLSSTISPRSVPQSKLPIRSNVCCEDLDSMSLPQMGQSAIVGAFYKSPPPPRVNLSLKVGILTVSDRAANGEYETGDLSGPAVEESLRSNINKINTMRNELDDTKASVSFCVKAIVPDDIEAIKSHLQQWCGLEEGGPVCDIVFTTGGTGFSSRDVTPEATLDIIEKEAPGLMSFVTSQCASTQPLAPLSRGTAGICDKTIVVNLPGNPAGVGQILDLLVPLLLYAVKDVKGM